MAQTGRPKAAFSYYAGDAPPVKDNLRARKASEQKQVFFKRLRLVPTIIAVTAIGLSVVYSTTLSSVANVKFAGEASPYRNMVEYRTGIEKLLASSLWNKSKLTINTTTTEDAILQAFPELDAANVALPVIGRRPTITVHSRQPALLLTTTTNAYVVDLSGRVVAEASQLLSSQREQLLTVQDRSGLQLDIGSQAVTAGTVTFILNVQAQLAAKKLVIVQATLPTVPNEVDFKLKDLSYYIKTDTTGDPRIEIGDFLAAKDSGVRPAEYMDVRVEEKVFYK